jgi:hypothetical protein
MTKPIQHLNPTARPYVPISCTCLYCSPNIYINACHHLPCHYAFESSDLYFQKHNPLQLAQIAIKWMQPSYILQHPTQHCGGPNYCQWLTQQNVAPPEFHGRAWIWLAAAVQEAATMMLGFPANLEIQQHIQQPKHGVRRCYPPGQ